jgi:flavin reductase (DIM6/NTAB) family NADH-FMN oxidoreductase RutF
MAVDASTFKAALGRFASGVTVVTVHTEEGDHGMTASAFSSLSLDPPLVLVCVNKDSTTQRRLEDSSGFAVSILSADQKSESNQYAGYGERPQDAFDEQGTSRGVHSLAPMLAGALAWLDCSHHATHDGGDHIIFVGRVEDATVFGERSTLNPLLYAAGRYRALGKQL